MNEEMKMIEKNSTWELVDRPRNKLIVGSLKVEAGSKSLVDEIDTYLIHCGFHRSSSEAILYVKIKESVGTLCVSIYVDDIVYTRSSAEMTNEFKYKIMSKYEMLDLGLLHHFLGIGITQIEGSIFIH